MKFIRYGSLVPQKHEIPDNEDDRSFHTAPVEMGFYAFPKGYIEPFLLGGVGSGSLQNGRYSYLKDDNGKPFEGLYRDFYVQRKEESEWRPGVFYDIWDWTDEWVDYFKRKHINKDKVKLWVLDSEDMEQSNMAENAEGMEDVLKYRIVIENKPRVFEYDGLVWSHIHNYCIHKGDGYDPDVNYKDKKIIDDCDVISHSGSWILTDMRTYKKALETYMRWWKYDDSKGNKFSNRGNAPMSHRSKDELEVYIESMQNNKKL